MSLFSEVRRQIPIEDVVREYVALKPAGAYLKGRCPFHSERTASFSVSPHKEIFYCFGCHETGDVVAFIAKVERCSQLEAAQLLVERFNLTIDDIAAEEVASLTERTDAKKRYFALCASVVRWCRIQLQNNSNARSYVEQRGISGNSVDQFSLGYFPGGYAAVKSLVNHVMQDGFLAKDLLDAHIVSEGKRALYSPFEERIIFPIQDHLGRFCGFGGRIFVAGDDRAKYYNSKENAYFTKGEILFGLSAAKKSIQETGRVYVVEGYVDAIAMVDNGFINTVATLGTACTPDHLTLLARYAQELYVLYDGDAAGQEAVLRLTELCWNANLELKVVRMDKGEDPASFLHSNGNLSAKIAQAHDIFSFFVAVYCQSFSAACVQRKLQAINKVIKVVAAVPDHLRRDLLFEEAARVLGVPVESIRKEAQRQPVNRTSDRIDLPAEPELYARISVLERRILAVILERHVLADDQLQQLVRSVGPQVKLIVEKTLAGSDLDEHERLFVNRLTIEHGGAISPEEYEQLVDQFQRHRWKDVVAGVKNELLRAQAQGDTARVKELVQQFQMLKNKMLDEGV